MIRGTTPTHTFTLPCDADMVKSVMVIYAQRDKEVVRKETADCTVESGNVSVTLTQKDTFAFDHTAKAQIQVRVLTTDGNVLASDIKFLAVKKCLNDIVME